MHYTDAIWTLRKQAPSWSVPTKKMSFICHVEGSEEAHVGKQACARTNPDRKKEVFLDGLTVDWLTQALSHWLLPSFREVLRNETSRKSYAEDKFKMGKDSDFESERRTDWPSSSPAAVYWAQSGWERGFSMLSMLWSSQLPSLGSKTVEESIHPSVFFPFQVRAEFHSVNSIAFLRE